MNQKEMILRYMAEYGSITPVDALREFGCMRLAARIADIRADGVDVYRIMEKAVNRYGDTVRFARYTIVDKV